MTNPEFASHSVSTTHQICLYSLKHGLGIHNIRLTWSCPILKVLVTWGKFLGPSGYCALINCTFIFCGANYEYTKIFQDFWHFFCLVGWGCRIYRLLLCRVVRPISSKCPRYDAKQSDGEAPVRLELWGMQSQIELCVK